MAITEGEKKVQLYATPEAARAFREFYEGLGMKQNEAGTRLFRWFMEQPEIVRRQILTPMPEEYAPDIARLILERMAATSPDEEAGPDEEHQDLIDQTDAETESEHGGESKPPDNQKPPRSALG